PSALNPPSPVAGLVPAGCNVLQFGAMIKHKTGKLPLSYVGYGCHCGLGGAKKPLDATDRCCHAHDCCYKKLMSPRCDPKLVTYRFSMQKTQITCKSKARCQRQSCECDKKAAECFQRSLKTYRDAYKNYPKFRCKGRAPSC
ncbi:PA2GE phospholipase, partial [Bucorvus abyssinicus]|nr:PA2GE phospholipase [Bucorvus abyssinicus]